ncbi:Agamous-like MADS-box protein AGL62 [Acorus calamus]|uniref:Agamous-like MADS-box protein AGL62 n=1 Tax=Acorus calamus TaxID=4465 RepID=A0AAV9FD90_ACOCL|nr:Agamous-like MADS-box protein AGL62 [Acorus calamus]
MPRNPGTGRKKIEIRPILNEEARQVTFSKRRMGLFKKAGELCILCGVEMAAIVYSPGGKAFSFGHPSVEAVSDRFLGLSNPNNMEAQQNRTTQWRELNKNCEAAEKRVEAGRATSASLDAELKSKVFYNDYYTGGSLDGCSLEEIQRKYNVMCQIKSELLRAAQLAFAPPPGPPANYPGGGAISLARNSSWSSASLSRDDDVGRSLNRVMSVRASNAEGQMTGLGSQGALTSTHAWTPQRMLSSLAFLRRHILRFKKVRRRDTSLAMYAIFVF